jgi:hypothetical protein
VTAVRVCTRCKAPVTEEHDPYMVGKFGRWKCPEELYAPIEVEMVETEKRRIVIEIEQIPVAEDDEDDVSAAARVESRIQSVIERVHGRR